MFLSIVVALVLALGSFTAAEDCQSQLPADIDSSLCDEIESVVFTMRYAVRDIDEKVKETVLVSLKEARRILDSTSNTTINDIKEILSSRQQVKRSVGDDLPSEVRTVAQNVMTNIENAVEIAKKKIRSSIGHAISTVDIQNDKIKTQAALLLRKVLAKRSTMLVKPAPLFRRDMHSDMQKALAAAAGEVKQAMNEAVTTSIQEYKKLMDYFAPSLKELFKKANLDGNVDQAEEDIEKLAIKASEGFVDFYDEFSKLSVGKAIKSVEALLSKVHEIGAANPNALTVLKDLLLHESEHISEVVVETTQQPDPEIQATVLEAAQKMLRDYETIQTMVNANM